MGVSSSLVKDLECFFFHASVLQRRQRTRCDRTVRGVGSKLPWLGASQVIRHKLPSPHPRGGRRDQAQRPVGDPEGLEEKADGSSSEGVHCGFAVGCIRSCGLLCTAVLRRNRWTGLCLLFTGGTEQSYYLTGAA